MLRLPFVVRAVTVDERILGGEGPDSYLRRVTAAKLDAVRATDLGRDVAAVLVADTVVISPLGVVLGKPAEVARESGRAPHEEVRSMVEQLAGATHEVRTRFALSPPEAGSPAAHAQTVTTRVTLRAMAPSEVLAYARAGEGIDKAGGYAIQGTAAAFVERLEGSYTNVVGLPLCELVVTLRELGWWA